MQFTAIDPSPDFLQLGGTYANILDPTVEIWGNVTYADVYVREANPAADNSSTLLKGADWVVPLVDRVGIKSPDQRFGSDSDLNLLRWYAGTAVINQSGLTHTYNSNQEGFNFTLRGCLKSFRQIS
ncbi:MAG: hypothetical protein KME35_06190 [Aphanocapsa sp. GSE-SYN-MK-11-07L]|nr:hypothetical protein [Aphanocapsa sp. GSE-SYN-MK-11-07L]